MVAAVATATVRKQFDFLSRGDVPFPLENIDKAGETNRGKQINSFERERNLTFSRYPIGW